MSIESHFGVRLPVAGPLASPDALVRGAKEADRLGFETVWLHDYICWNRQLDSVHISCGSKEAFLRAVERPDYEPRFFESLTSLAFLAGVTERVRLGVAVLILPYRDALVTAKQLACIDVLSGGRLDLGIGQGAAKTTFNTEFEVMGISRAKKTRHAREVFEAMREVWREGSASYHGEFVQFTGAEVYPKPIQKPQPRVWMGGSVEKSLDMVADYADGWLSFWVSPDQFPQAMGELRRRLEERGRDTSSFIGGTEIQIYLADTPELARKEVESTMLAFEEGYAGTTGGFAEEGNRADTLKEIWSSSLIGSPESVSEEITRYLEAGCTAFELKFIYSTVDQMLEQWEMFTERVLPNVG